MSSRLCGLAEFTALAIVAVLAVFGGPWIPTGSIPTGYEGTATVPLFNLWTIGWNLDALSRGYDGYWHARIFYPHAYTFAFSEPQPLTALLAPVVWISGSLPFAYNLWLVLTLAANGFASLVLLRRLKMGYVQAWGGALLVEFLPFVHWQLGVLQLAALLGTIWSIERLVALAAEPTWQRSIWLGVAAALTYYTCNYYGLFLSLLLLLCGWIVVLPRLRSARFWALAVLSGLLAVGLTWPLIRLQQHCREIYGWNRDRATVEQLSAMPGDYLVCQTARIESLSLSQFSDEQRRNHWRLGVGTLSAALAVLGAITGLVRRRRRRWTLFVLAVVASFYFVSLGYHWNWFSVEPYQWLAKWYPGFGQIRSPFRCAVYAQLGCMFLAAEGLDAFRAQSIRRTSRRLLRLTLGTRFRSSRRPRLLRPLPLISAAAVLSAAVTIAEVWPAATPLRSPPRASDHQRWMQWITENMPDGGAVACLPFPPGRMPADYESTVEWMYLGLHHSVPLINGYSGYFPDDYLSLREFALAFPSGASLQELQRSGARYCLVDRRWQTREMLTAPRAGSLRLQHVFADDAALVDIYVIANKPERAVGQKPEF